VNRLEAKHAVRRVKKIGNAHIFEAVISRASAQRRQIDELLCLLGGCSQPLMAYLVESGNLTLDDIKGAGGDAQDSWRRNDPSCCSGRAARVRPRCAAIVASSGPRSTASMQGGTESAGRRVIERSTARV
jgi:hypothetical protein